MPCPLSGLNPDSFASLSHLSLHTVSSIFTPSFEIDFPYGCPWKDALMKTTAIEYFNLHAELHCYSDIQPSSFGSQWGDIPDLLGDSTQLPLLKEVHVLIQHSDRRGSRRRTEPMTVSDSVAAQVYPQWSSPLKRRLEEGKLLSFSYKAEAMAGY